MSPYMNFENFISQDLINFKCRWCLAKVNIQEPKKIKISPRTIDVVFIGYSINSNTYLEVNLEIFENFNDTIIESKDVI